MPSGFTAIIEEDDGCTFEEFVWRCARGIDYASSMREESLSKPITEESIAPVSTYRAECLARAKSRMIELETMSPEAAEALATAEWKQANADGLRLNMKLKEKARRYGEMRERVEAWQPPTPSHSGLKAFMLKEIELATWGSALTWPETKRLTGEQWLANELAEARRDVAHQTDVTADEEEQRKSAVGWVRALRESVPQPPPRKR